MPTVPELIANARVLVFDLDGTLVDTLEDLGEALDSALLAHGHSRAPRRAVLSHLHLGLEATARAVLRVEGVHPLEHSRVVEAYLQHYQERGHACSHLYAGVHEFLTTCLQRGQRMAVCTNKAHDEAHALLSQLGVADAFGSVVGIDTCGIGKPDPKPLLWALECLECPPELALFIGDSFVDADCATKAGVNFLLHEQGYGADAVIKRAAMTLRFSSYADLATSIASDKNVPLQPS